MGRGSAAEPLDPATAVLPDVDPGAARHRRAAAPRGWPGRVLGAFALLPLLLPRATQLPEGAFALSLLDVGQGQATLLRTARHSLLVDTGPGFPDGGDLGTACWRRPWRNWV